MRVGQDDFFFGSKKIRIFCDLGLAFWRRLCYHKRADLSKIEYGRLAQLVEHLLDVQEVTGSSPVPSTTHLYSDPKGFGYIFIYRKL